MPTSPEDINYSSLPDYMRGPMKEWIEYGRYQGDFLMAVLSNDLMRACGHADGTNRHRLFDYAFFLYNQAPRGSFGSESAVERWHKAGGWRTIIESAAEDVQGHEA